MKHFFWIHQYLEYRIHFDYFSKHFNWQGQRNQMLLYCYFHMLKEEKQFSSWAAVWQVKIDRGIQNTSFARFTLLVTTGDRFHTFILIIIKYYLIHLMNILFLITLTMSKWLLSDIYSSWKQSPKLVLNSVALAICHIIITIIDLFRSFYF